MDYSQDSNELLQKPWEHFPATVTSYITPAGPFLGNEEFAGRAESGISRAMLGTGTGKIPLSLAVGEIRHLMEALCSVSLIPS